MQAENLFLRRQLALYIERGVKHSRLAGNHDIPGAVFAASSRRSVCHSSRINLAWTASRIFADACRRVTELLRTTGDMRCDAAVIPVILERRFSRLLSASHLKLHISFFAEVYRNSPPSTQPVNGALASNAISLSCSHTVAVSRFPARLMASSIAGSSTSRRGFSEVSALLADGVLSAQKRTSAQDCGVLQLGPFQPPGGAPPVFAHRCWPQFPNLPQDRGTETECTARDLPTSDSNHSSRLARRSPGHEFLLQFFFHSARSFALLDS